jgi:hypothetical protein
MLLSAEFLSKFRGRNIAEARVAPLAVLEAFDVFLYGCLCVGSGEYISSFLKILQKLFIGDCHLLAAAVRMMNQSWRRTLVAHGSPQHRCGQTLRHPLAHDVANQLAGKTSLMLAR